MSRGRVKIQHGLLPFTNIKALSLQQIEPDSPTDKKARVHNRVGFFIYRLELLTPLCIYIYKHKYVVMLMISVNTKTISALVCPTVSQKQQATCSKHDHRCDWFNPIRKGIVQSLVPTIQEKTNTIRHGTLMYPTN